MFNLPHASSVCADVISRLLETKLPAISGEPTYHTIKAMEEKLVSALGGIHTEQGGGNMGFIGLLFSFEKSSDKSKNIEASIKQPRR